VLLKQETEGKGNP